MPTSALPLAAVAAVLGTLCASPLPPDIRLLAALGTTALGLRLVVVREPAWVRAAVVATLVLCAANAIVRERLLPHVEETRTQRFTGVVVAQRETSDGGRDAYTVDLSDGRRVLVAAAHGAAIGDRIVIRGRLEPFDEPRNPGEPSERELQRARGNDARIASATILHHSPDPHPSFAVTLARAHAWALQELRDRLDEPNASIVAGELWGERADLPPDLRQEFQETGTVHVLVTAGLHVGLVAALIVAAGIRLTLPRPVTSALAIAGVWGFALFSGADVPAERAATMATAMLVARACGASATSWNALALAALVVACTRPFSVPTPSFALSFACVGAIFATLPLLERMIDCIDVPDRLREALALTVATQLGTWPITAAVFLQFSPYALLANVAIVPCVPFTMALGALQLAASPLPALAQAFANLNGWMLAWTVGIVHLVASLPGASIPMTPAPTALILAYQGALVALAPLVRRDAATIAVGALLFAGSLVLWPPLVRDRHLVITVLDVGQADAIVIRRPNGHALLVDAGGRLERGPTGPTSSAELVGERIVVPFLLRSGIHQLDALVISHPHGDHVGGCAPVLRMMRVAEIADSGQTYGGHAYHDCLDTAAAAHVPIVQPRAGLVWRTADGITLTFLGPSLPFISGKNAINDNSVAFMLQYRAFRMLFTGDAGVAAEQRFIREGIELRASVLKVGHHGSAYSSSADFIAAVRPRVAIVSVGRHNLFGHPAPSTLETLQNSGAAIYRTDENAAVTVTTDGDFPSMQCSQQAAEKTSQR